MARLNRLVKRAVRLALDFLAAWCVLASAPLHAEEPSVVVLRAALVGTALPDDDVIGAFVLSSPAARREALALVASAEGDRASGPEAEARRRAMLHMAEQLRGAPKRFASGLAAVEGRHPNAEHLIDAGLDIAAALGDADDVEVLHLLAGQWPAVGVPRIAARPAALREALVGLMGRDPRAVQAVRQRFRSAPRDLAEAQIDALGELASPTSLRALVGLVGVRPELDDRALNRLQGGAKRCPTSLHPTELAVLRRCLARPEAFARAQAASALGAFGDVESVPELVELLAERDGSVVEAAHAALRELTGMTMGPDPRRWRLWYREQADTWGRRSGELLGRLAASDRGELLGALLDVGLMRLHRGELAPALVELVEARPDDEVLVHAAAAIESLRATSALGCLVELLEEASPSVRERAHRALRVVTGADLPDDAARWRRLLALDAERGA